jgi:N-acetylmuramoyl-L-alanine amidase
MILLPQKMGRRTAKIFLHGMRALDRTTVRQRFVGLTLVVLGMLTPPRSAAGDTYAWTTLGNLARAYEMQPPALDTQRIVLRRRFDTVSFEENSRRMLFNGVAFYLNSSIIKYRNEWLIAVADVDNVVGPLLCPAHALAAAQTSLVMLDPGHGGDDPGARDGWKFDEKRLTLDIARRARAKLREFQVDARLSRERDMSVGLEERCWRAERLGATLFVSIHLNAARDRRTSGIETFIIPSAGYAPTADREGALFKVEKTAYPANRYDAANAVLAYYLHKGLLAGSRGEDRGIRRARFHVIKNVSCPAALVECGFMSNRQEAEKLAQESYRDALAEGIARGILTYLSRAREAHLPPVSGL